MFNKRLKNSESKEGVVTPSYENINKEVNNKIKQKGLIKCVKDASKEFDELVKGVSHEKIVTTNKKSKYVILVLIFIMILVSCSIFIYNKNNNVTISNVVNNKDKVYQYDTINVEDFNYIEGKHSFRLSELSKGHSYKIMSNVYKSRYVGVMVNNHVYSVNCNVIYAEDIVWYSSKSITGRVKQEELRTLKAEDIRGSIVYEDETFKNIKPDKISICTSTDGTGRLYVLISYKGNQFSWFPEMEG